jgi:hypothetical protein
VSKLIEFLAFVAVLYLFEALWDGFNLGQWKKLAKFVWLCLGFTLIKFLVKAAAWAISL